MATGKERVHLVQGGFFLGAELLRPKFDVTRSILPVNGKDAVAYVTGGFAVGEVMTAGAAHKDRDNAPCRQNENPARALSQAQRRVSGTP
jgi:hypothetical protein